MARCAPGGDVVLFGRGAYELLFDLDAPEGSRGSEGCTVISFEENARLPFTGTPRPRCRPCVGNTRASTFAARRPWPARPSPLAHTGWKDGPDWDAAYDYFARAWEIVLARLTQRFSTGEITSRA